MLAMQKLKQAASDDTILQPPCPSCGQGLAAVAGHTGNTRPCGLANLCLPGMRSLDDRGR
jgi:hypothetical protein